MDKDAAKESETRQVHTRSRTGCTNCRQRRIRCDEKRPFCLNCKGKDLSCSYSPPKIPLRDRRAQARTWDQAPWIVQASKPLVDLSSSKEVALLNPIGSVGRDPPGSSFWQLVPGEMVDPFDTLPIKMPLKSKELLHYFHQTGCVFGTLPGATRDECIALGTRDPDILQNILLVAGLHYAWNVGDLSIFESTFLFHKVQSIRSVNTWLDKTSQERDVMLCAKHITTLCFTECCLGNFGVAETHLEGLMKYLDTQYSKQIDALAVHTIERELTDRYLILSYNVVHALKSRLDDFLATSIESQLYKCTEDPKQLARLVHEWHLHEATGLGLRLKAIRLLPFFFSPPPIDKEPQHVDVGPVLDCMKDITRFYDLRYLDPSSDATAHTAYQLWDSGGPSKLLYSVVNAHIQSFSGKPHLKASEQHALLSSWTGFCVAVGMYLISVLGIWNQGSPVEIRLHCHILQILKRDVQSSLADLGTMSKEHQGLWLWKLFAGYISLTHAHPLTCDPRLQSLAIDFALYVQQWAKATGITEWKEVRAVLTEIVWPVNFQREDLAELLWKRSLRQHGRTESVE